MEDSKNLFGISIGEAIAEFRRDYTKFQRMVPIRNREFKYACEALRLYMTGENMFMIAQYLCDLEDDGILTPEAGDTIYYVVKCYRMMGRG